MLRALLLAIVAAAGAVCIQAQTAGANAWKFIGPAPTQWPPFARADSWFEGGIRTSGRVNAVVVDPKSSGVMYVGADGGDVWKTLDAGAHWTPLFGRAGESPRRLDCA